MPARRGRPRAGIRRIDAAIDHFAVMGYAARDVRAVITDLLELYGGADAWFLLEDGGYRVVHDRLFEIEEERANQDPDQQQQVEPEPEPLQLQEPAADEVAQEIMTISEVHMEVPAETESVDEEAEDQALALEFVVPLNAAKRPCYGWLSESEDEEEEEPTGPKHLVHVQSPGERAQ